MPTTRGRMEEAMNIEQLRSELDRRIMATESAKAALLEADQRLSHCRLEEGRARLDLGRALMEADA